VKCYRLDNQGTESQSKRDFPCCPDWPWHPPCRLYNGYQVFPMGEVAAVWCWPLTSFYCQVVDGVELHLPPLCPHRHIMGWPSPFLVLNKGTHPCIWDLVITVQEIIENNYFNQWSSSLLSTNYRRIMTHSLNNTAVWSRTIKINYCDKLLSHEHIFFLLLID
jgi:hypothetical protein